MAFQSASNPSTSTTDGEIRALIILPGVAPPAGLKVDRLQRLAAEISFELSDVPTL